MTTLLVLLACMHSPLPLMEERPHHIRRTLDHTYDLSRNPSPLQAQILKRDFHANARPCWHQPV